MSAVRRSSRVAAMKDEIDYTGKKILKTKSVPKTTTKKASVAKGKGRKKESEVIEVDGEKEGLKSKKRGRRGSVNGEPALKKVVKSKSRSAKKEEAVVIEDSEEEEEEVEEEEEEEEVKSELEVGDSIPSNIELTLEDSSKINLKEFAKKAGILIIFAYPKASTPGCTRQANGFRDEYKELKGLKAEVLGLSNDNEKSQLNFKNKHELPYHLICDVKRELIKLFGCPKTAVSGTIRSHFIFVNGVLKVKEIKISPENSFNKVLEFVKSLKK
ncbi:hypothetical protein CANINC_003236 [Pichia inconspicua]|uniref:thioredoxin-dependent peroxiredoxin n=1 Tax=Pichia inconspicua TaxID=52247 RepID=A0A4T0WZA9_9ASCO|nr:hypothetical protein CANINC_003236 [[Candida] inconspicua]